MIGNRYVSLDILRILACLAVITIHTSGSPILFGMVAPGTYEYTGCMIMDALSRWSVPVFAMLTGFFMLDLCKELTVKKLFGKYILRLFSALLFWSVFYALTLHLSIYPLGSQGGHFWYVGMCIGLYLAMPIMRLIACDLKVLAYFCWTWLAIEIYKFLGIYVVLPLQIGDVMFVDYVGYCLFAYYLKTLSKSKRIRTIIYLLGILGVFVTITMAVMTQDADTVFFCYTSPNVIFMAMALFVFFLHNPVRTTDSVANRIKDVSQCTFGIYLVHMWILIELFSRLHRFIPNAILLCVVSVAVTFCLGGVGVWVISRIPLLKKYIV